MKKLMIAAAAAAMIGGAYADVCDDEPGYTGCLAYDVKLTLKTLGPKATTCKYGSDCDDTTKGKVYFLDDVSRKIKGYAWTCDYTCDEEATYEIALWDEKNKAAIAIGGTDSVSFANVFRYAKKANKVAAFFNLGTENADLYLAGVKGKFVEEKDSEYSYIKSISGNVAGLVAPVPPKSVTTVEKAANICEDDVYATEPCGDIVKVGLCDCFENYCDDTLDTVDDLVPASGTWSMKYNKKVTAGKKGTINGLIPAYAL